MLVILISLAAFAATLCGGLFALRFRDKLHLILGFSAGAVIAVAFFDLMPEALELGGAHFGGATIPALVSLGFFVYLILDRTIFLHGHSHEQEQDHSHDHGGDHESAMHHEVDSISKPHPRRGILGAGSLCIHSFLDGVAIGLAFQVSAAIGTIVAVAVLIHDFSDGINTVGLISRNSASRGTAFRWLLADAIAPVLGVISTMFFALNESALAIILALFCGFFLYIGASDLIPESHHRHPTMLTTVMTILGAGVLYAAIRLAGV